MSSKHLLIALGLLAGWVIHLQQAPAARPAQGAQATFGDWQVSISEAGAAQAFTTHASGQQLGVLCAESGCVAYLKSPEACEEGAQAPAVFRIDDEIVRARLVCAELGNGADTDARWVAAEARLPKLLALAQERISVAQPELGGRGVAVSRFSIIGADMATMSALIYTGNRRSSTRDQKMGFPAFDGVL